MHRAVRFLRVALPIAFLTFLLLIGVSYSSRRVNPPTSSVPERSTIRPEPVKSVAYEFDDTQTVGGEVLSRIRARRVMGFDSGWYTLEDVEMTIYRGDGWYQLSAPQAQFHDDTRAAEVKKGVRLRASNGIEVQTEEMKFDGNRMANKIPLSFTAQNWTGKAGGIDLNLELETMFLVGGVEATTKPAKSGEPPVHVVSKGAEFLQKIGHATFREDVIMTRAGDEFRNQAVTAKLDESRKVMVGLEGCCAVEMDLKANSALLPAEAAQGPTRITAERFLSEVGPQGEIRAIIALGGPARAQFVGPPKRNLTAIEIRIDMAADQISRIRAAGGVTLHEHAPTGLRELVSLSQTILIDPATRRASSAVAELNVKYTDPKSGATAQRANYDFYNQLLVLSTVGQAVPSLTADGHTLRATTIDVSQKDGVLKARENVAAQLSQKQGGISASQTAIFPKGDGPVFVNADNLVMRQNERIAVFSGNVRAWQGNNVLFANTVQVEGQGETLNARENVRALLYNVRAGEQRKTPIEARSNVLIARRAERKVDLEGNVKIDDEPRTVAADRATIFLDASRRVERVEASSNVVLTDKVAAQKAVGTHLIYRLAEKRLFLDGSPATVTDPRGTLSGKQVVFDIARNKVNVSGDTPTQATYNPQ